MRCANQSGCSDDLRPRSSRVIDVALGGERESLSSQPVSLSPMLQTACRRRLPMSGRAHHHQVGQLRRDSYGKKMIVLTTSLANVAPSHGSGLYCRLPNHVR